MRNIKGVKIICRKHIDGEWKVLWEDHLEGGSIVHDPKTGQYTYYSGAIIYNNFKTYTPNFGEMVETEYVYT